MNIIIYIVVILTIFYFLLKWWSSVSTKKMSKNVRFLTILILIIMAILFAVGGKILLTLPLTLLSLALVKLKGLSIIQIFSLFRLIQTLRQSGRFSFNQSQNNKFTTLSVTLSYKILNVNLTNQSTNALVNKAYIKLLKKIHPDVSPQTSRLSTIVIEAKDIVLRDIS